MFSARLAGEKIKLVETLKIDVDALIGSNYKLPGITDTQAILASTKALYWSIIDKQLGSLLGIIGTTQGLESNQIFYKFKINGIELYDAFEESLRLVLDYLDYANLDGEYYIVIDSVPYGIKQSLKRNGFEFSDRAWRVNISDK